MVTEASSVQREVEPVVPTKYLVEEVVEEVFEEEQPKVIDAKYVKYERI